MAIATILGDLVLRDRNPKSKTVWSKYQKVRELYDIIIQINSLGQLQTDGWEIKLREDIEKTVQRQKTSTNVEQGVIVAVFGAYRCGKTFLLSKLCNVEVPHNNLKHTEGISIIAGQMKYENIAFMDTAGIDTPASNKDVCDKKVTEAFVRKVVLHLSSCVIIVVNRLRGTDQKYIEKILDHCKSDANGKTIIIVHNLSDITENKAINDITTEEVKNIYDALYQEKPWKVPNRGTNIKYFSSNLEGFELTHFILAKEGSSAAKTWNMQSLAGIMEILKASTKQKDIKIISAMIETVNAWAPQLFVVNKLPQMMGCQDKIEIVQHESEPYIVLFSRKSLQNRRENPYPLEVSNTLFYDPADYSIQINTDQWQPRYSLWTTDKQVFIVLEMAGVEEEDYKIMFAEMLITVEGVRNNFVETTRPVINHALKIPTGKFQLHISFRCPIDTNPEKREKKSSHGFVTLIIRKKELLNVLDKS